MTGHNSPATSQIVPKKRQRIDAPLCSLLMKGTAAIIIRCQAATLSAKGKHCESWKCFIQFIVQCQWMYTILYKLLPEPGNKLLLNFATFCCCNNLLSSCDFLANKQKKRNLRPKIKTLQTLEMLSSSVLLWKKAQCVNDLLWLYLYFLVQFGSRENSTNRCQSMDTIKAVAWNHASKNKCFLCFLQTCGKHLRALRSDHSANLGAFCEPG